MSTNRPRNTQQWKLKKHKDFYCTVKFALNWHQLIRNCLNDIHKNVLIHKKHIIKIPSMQILN
jgi:hypothetical protein